MKKNWNKSSPYISGVYWVISSYNPKTENAIYLAKWNSNTKKWKRVIGDPILTISKKITVKTGDEILNISYWIPALKPNITSEIIDEIVSVMYGISLVGLKGKNRSRKYVEPRHTAIYLYHTILKIPVGKIQREFKLNTHGAVNNAIKNVRNWLETDKEYREKFKKIKNLI